MREYARHKDLSFKRFYARRALKIIPPFILSLIVIYSLSFTSLFSESLVWNHLPGDLSLLIDSLRELPFFVLFVGNLPLSLGYIESTTPAVLISWTLAIEEQFYLIQPLLLVWAFKKPNPVFYFRLVLLGGIVFSLILRFFSASFFEENFYRNFNNTFSLTQFDSIAMGVLLALELHYSSSALRSLSEKVAIVRGPIVWIILLSGFLAITFMVNYSVFLSYTLGLSLINIYFVFVLLILVIHPMFQFGSNTISGLGKNGYCLYLTHHLALILAYEFISPNLSEVVDSAALYFGRLLLAGILAVVMAKLLYSLSEKPFESLRSKLRNN